MITKGIIKYNDGALDYLLYRSDLRSFGIAVGLLAADESSMRSKVDFEGSADEVKAFLLVSNFPGHFTMGCFAVFLADTIIRKLTARECDQYRQGTFSGSLLKKARRYFLLSQDKKLTALGGAVLKLLQEEK